MLTEVILLFDTGRLCLSSHGPEAVGPAGEGLCYIRKIYRNWGGVWDQKGTTAGFIPSVPQTACKRIVRAPTISALRAAVDGDEVLGLRVAQYNRARGKQPETELLLSQLARDPSRRK